MHIELTGREISVAASIAVFRQIACFKRQMRQAASHPRDRDWQDAIEGALGECAFAKLHGFYWDCSVNTFRRGGDVAGWEVRTHWFDGPGAAMLIRPNDADDRRYALMQGCNGAYRYRGWILGGDAKRDKWLRTAGENDRRPPCYWVPVDQLQIEL
jgi:hypothetical protein